MGIFMKVMKGAKCFHFKKWTIVWGFNYFRILKISKAEWEDREFLASWYG